MNESLQKRIRIFLSELGIPATAFCKRVSISYSAYQNWKRGACRLSQATQERISNYLSKYNF